MTFHYIIELQHHEREKNIRKGIKFKDIEIININYGKPTIKLQGSTAKFLKRKIKNKKNSIYLSLSDDIPWAQATVIISYSI